MEKDKKYRTVDRDRSVDSGNAINSRVQDEEAVTQKKYITLKEQK